MRHGIKAFPCWKVLTRLLHELKRAFTEPHVAGGRGTFLYPPGAFHEWHTNQAHVEGWRMYLVQVDEPERSWFAFKDPRTGKVHRRPDRTGKINMFRVTKGKPFWHTIYSATNRYSYGTVLSDYAAGRILKQLQQNAGAAARLGIANTDLSTMGIKK
jgi:hypothetical protein